VALLKKYTLEGKEIGEVEVDASLSEATVHSQLVKDYIIALRKNSRQWSANTKGRSEVKHTTKKPHPQKGTGGARQGSLVAPQYRGGGRVFAPKPKYDMHVRINAKERRSATKALIGDKIRNGRMFVLDSSAMKGPKTTVVQDLLDTMGCMRRVLFLGERTIKEVETMNGVQKVSVRSDLHENFKKSLRNIPGVEFSLASDINGYAMALCDDLIVTEAALKELQEWLA
jgi:large subunit ribosomal protein L4